MPDNPLRTAFKNLIKQVSDELGQQGSSPEVGTVVALNADGTVDVQGQLNLYGGVGAPQQYVVGAIVLIITSKNNERVAIPR